MLALLLAAAPALPAPLSADERRQFRCVAVLATAANGQARGQWQDVPALGELGRSYVGIVGDRAAAVAGRDARLVGAWLIDAALGVRREGFDRRQLDGCLADARAAVAADGAAGSAR